ncbi:MAG: hypothetical protein EOS10_00035 [Mesorhizobium sp.]|uniref:hypothetical protein n=1 Tax=Mesorhizobium sp. TaxID=1871066 RepID=UPI000FE78F7C|nr:hypothetical protein [Mesorhizobium sp.]RWO34730.1 MAG: hypothetical protein EOS10_00035 [Mesorhizobium sp.]
MPRNGAGTYSLPGTYPAVPGETILATQHNDPLEDLEQDANTARPLVAGGTGASTAIAANDALNTTSVNLASSATVDLSTATGTVVNITGTTTITALGTVSSGSERVLVFAGILTLTHNATSLILPGAANITTAAGDTATMRSKGSGNWVCVSYQRASGLAVAVTAIPDASETVKGIVELATDAEAQTGTDTARAITAANLQAVTATETRKGVAELATAAEVTTGTDTARVPSVSTMGSHKGMAKAWVYFDASTGTPVVGGSFNVTSITDNGVGDYTINFTTALANANYSVAGSAYTTSGGVRTHAIGVSARLTTSVRIRVLSAGSDTGVDATDINVMVMG